MKNFRGFGQWLVLFLASAALILINYNLNRNSRLTSRLINQKAPSNNQGECVVGGCNGELCQDASDAPLASICLYKPEYECYKSATCERQVEGNCDWTQTEELTSCLAEYQ